jgi:hypothetical protein
VFHEDIRGQGLARDVIPSLAGVAGLVDLGFSRFEALYENKAMSQYKL